MDIQHFIAEEVTAWHGVFENADLFINAIYTPASVPSILQRCKSYQQKGLTTVPRGGCLKIMGICSEQIRTQCTVGSEVCAGKSDSDASPLAPPPPRPPMCRRVSL